MNTNQLRRVGSPRKIVSVNEDGYRLNLPRVWYLNYYTGKSDVWVYLSDDDKIVVSFQEDNALGIAAPRNPYRLMALKESRAITLPKSLVEMVEHLSDVATFEMDANGALYIKVAQYRK